MSLTVSDDGVRKAFARLADAERVYVDSETNGLNRISNESISVSFCDARPGDGQELWATYIPWGHETGEEQASRELVAGLWQDLVRSRPPQSWRYFNKPFDRRMLDNALGAAPDWHDDGYDVYHLAYLCNENGEHKLKVLAKNILGIEADEQTALEPFLGDMKNSGHAKVPVVVEAPYAAQDARLTCMLDARLRPVAETEGLLGALLLETRLMPVIEAMERVGVLVDTDYMKQQQELAEEETEQLRREFAALTGWEGSVASPDQLKTLIYDDWKLRPGRLTPKGEPSTDKWALERLRQENPEHEREFEILEKHAELSTLLETFFRPIPELVDATGAVHTSYNQMVRTGRMSSSRPNLQQIPARKGPIVRSGFRVRPGRSWLLVDYSQIELRVLAHYSQSQQMLQAYERGEDIHQQTADLLGIDRQTAKTVNFADVYGAGVAQLARQAKVSMGEAAQIKARKKRHYPEISKFSYTASHLAESRGWVKTVSGRRRRFTEKFYRAGNAIVQGSAADVMKLAMVGCHNTLLEKYGAEARLVMSIHDELVFEVKSGLERAVFEDVQAIMTAAYRPPLTVRLEVEASTTSTTWGDKAKLVG